ncbi:hypothetical protein ACFL59_03535, partial [Planctomycetota bacterium]
MERMQSHYRIAHRGLLRILYADRDCDVVEPTAAGMRTAVRTVQDRLGVALDLPLFNVFIAPNRAEYDRLVAHLTSTPTRPSRVGQPQGHDLYLLSPTAWPTEAVPELLGEDGRYDPAIYLRLLVHETVHMVEEDISPRDA